MPEPIIPALTRYAPTIMTSVSPRLHSRFMEGFVIAISRSALRSFSTTSLFASSKRSFSYSVLESAFMIRTPVMFSWTRLTSESSAVCVLT